MFHRFCSWAAYSHNSCLMVLRSMNWGYVRWPQYSWHLTEWTTKMILCMATYCRINRYVLWIVALYSHATIWTIRYCFVSVQLKLLVRDSKLQIDPAIEAVGQLLLGPERCVGFITAEASGPTKAMCPILKEKNVDRAMISCYATSTQLSKPSFSNLLRTPPSDDVPAMMMATLMKGVFAM